MLHSSGAGILEDFAPTVQALCLESAVTYTMFVLENYQCHDEFEII